MTDLPADSRPYRVLVVCTGNICRSPMGEVVLREKLADAGLADLVEVASAGISDEEHGNPIDRRARAVLAEHGYPVPDHRAHQVAPGELGRYDLALAMTNEHARALRRRADVDGTASTAQVRLWREFDATAPHAAGADDLDVPDPWFGSHEGFYDTLRVVQAGADGLVAHLRDVLAGRPGVTASPR
ncbi:low molecular weight protein-tyrosine-phosphatase [Georgenia yuyongxinii]